jgi:uncharacterized RDD family membrane protein YckC/Tfp pilus assembly major pilin PilA
MYCSKCGAVIASGGTFCAACGAPVGGRPAAAASIAGSGAGFWTRWVALLLDALVMLLPMVLLAVLLAIGGADEWLVNIILLGCWWLYFALQESSVQQATLGKRAMGILVTDGHGGRLNFGRASGRHFAAVINYLTLLIGYGLAGMTATKQGLHDMLANTRVVNRDDRRPFPVWAIVLLAMLAAGVPVLGILAAIAIPAYQDYSVRVQVADGLRTAAPMRVAYAEALISSGQRPPSAEAIGMAPIESGWATVDISDGLVVITFNAQASAPIAGRSLALEPIADPTAFGQVDWICAHQAHPSGQSPSQGRPSAASRTTVEPRHLPASCR